VKATAPSIASKIQLSMAPSIFSSWRLLVPTGKSFIWKPVRIDSLPELTGAVIEFTDYLHVSD
jgi:hypothetical protein